MSYGYLSLALLLFAMAGLLIASAAYDGGALPWVTAVLALVLGALSAAAGIVEPRRRRAGSGPPPEWDQAAAPRLGEMLVGYGLISKDQLAQALARQKDTKDRLGQVLVEMELVTHAQVAEVLEVQFSRRGARFVWGTEPEQADQQQSG